MNLFHRVSGNGQGAKSVHIDVGTIELSMSSTVGLEPLHGLKTSLPITKTKRHHEFLLIFGLPQKEACEHIYTYIYIYT